jgi:hypothetical protein
MFGLQNGMSRPAPYRLGEADEKTLVVPHLFKIKISGDKQKQRLLDSFVVAVKKNLL